MSAHRVPDRRVPDERSFISLFQQSIDAVYIGTLEGEILDVNQAWLDLFGYVRDELARVNAIDFYVNPAERADFLRRICETGSVQDEVLYKRKDGSEFICHRSLVALRDESGAIVGYQGINRDVSRLRQAEESLRRSEARYRSLFEHSMDAIYIGTPDGRVIDVNKAWLDLFGYTREELPSLRAADFYADPADRDEFTRRMAETGYVQDVVRYRRKDGSEFDCQRAQVALRDESGTVLAYQGINRDITRAKEAERNLRESERQYRQLFEQSMDAIYLGTPQGRIIDVNRAWLELFGYTRKDLPRLTAFDLYANPEDRDTLVRKMARKGRVTDEVSFKKKDGTVFDCERSVVAQKDIYGVAIAYQAIFRDVTERNRARAELERLARFDMLTGVLNRRSILEKLQEWVVHARRYAGCLSVVLMDIDHFKQVNDRYGHQMGDRALADAAGLLQRSVRKTDSVGRYGGEEFLIILPRTDAAGAAVMAERTRAQVQELALHDGDGQRFAVTASFGVAEWRAEDEDSLVGRVDRALYAAKAAGRNCVRVAPLPERPA